uniref:FAD-binding FR-type domain-containing protein n=1 Tax=Fibrocapsa japonica TaxID=94617 RepID=A0A7S2UV64_9STRA
MVFGVSWEAMIRIHRWLGYLFLALGIAHVICMEMAIAEQGYAMPQNIFKIPLDYHADNFTIPLMFLAFVALLITQGILSLEIVRRRMYEVFYYAHHMALVFFVVMLWHANMAWYYVIGGLALWVVDRGVRMFRNLSNVNVLDAECLDGGIVKLSYLAESGGAGPLKGEETPMQHRAGQFIYLNVPAISTLQWHPFTISSAPSDNATTNHIKNMGPGTFTDSLYQMVHTLSQAGLAHQLAINVDGPYGLPVEFGKYTHILFVAGGIGVTPLHSCFRELYVNVLEGTGRLSGLASVKLVWAARDMGVFTAFKDTLSAVKANPGYRIFSYDLFLTENKDVLKAAPEKSPHGSQLTTTAGRPDINGMISDLQEFGKKALVFACGPAKMQKECQQLSMTYGVDYHGETFEL